MLLDFCLFPLILKLLPVFLYFLPVLLQEFRKADLVVAYIYASVIIICSHSFSFSCLTSGRQYCNGIAF